ncbi:SNF2 domain-containing protein CLASSY [Trifolium repens]|nr:SNF2 domain-containing protein CLASSY [Trifolium repens]
MLGLSLDGSSKMRKSYEDVLNERDDDEHFVGSKEEKELTRKVNDEKSGEEEEEEKKKKMKVNEISDSDVHEKKEEVREEESIQVLWDEMEMAMALLEDLEAEPQIGNLETNKSPSNSCEHDTILDEEIGVYCKRCDKVITEIRHITQLVVDRYPNE